jgi:hypothetical protein
MMQVARNLTDQFSGSLVGKSHLILDRGVPQGVS